MEVRFTSAKFYWSKRSFTNSTSSLNYIHEINCLKMLKNIKVYLVLWLSIGLIFNATAQKNEKAQAELKQMMTDLRVVGLSVAVVKDGKIIYSNALGLKNVEKNTPLSTDDIFRIASISKSFCATSIMQLVEAKKLSLDDDISDLVGFKIRNPNFPDKVITLKMLMSHTSSLNDSAGYFTLDMIDPSKNNGNEKSYSKYEPGSAYKYCNLNYTLVGVVIERASGMRFDNYVRANIIKPLGLYAGYNVDSLDRKKFGSIYAYNKKTDAFTESTKAYEPNRAVWNTYQLGYSAYSFSPTGGMKISATDLAKYMTMHMYKGVYNGVRIISEKSAKLMQNSAVNIAEHDDYGLAIRIRQTPDIAENTFLVGHTGSASGLYSAMFFNPDKKFGFVVMSSGSLPDTVGTIGTRKVLVDAMNILYKNFIK